MIEKQKICNKIPQCYKKDVTKHIKQYNIEIGFINSKTSVLRLRDYKQFILICDEKINVNVRTITDIVLLYRSPLPPSAKLLVAMGWVAVGLVKMFQTIGLISPKLPSTVANQSIAL